jgi:magnesium-transporting ATPase (P-type)
VLFKNATALETSARIDTVVMDKTGTLTRGEPEVTDLRLFDGTAELSRERVLALVAAATPVDPALRPALAQHDLTYRRNVAELDPANVFADRMLGVPMRERLVRILWGGEREAR